MATTPIGNLAGTVFNLQTLVANSSTFQSTVGAASVAEALRFCYQALTDPNHEADRVEKTFRRDGRKYRFPPAYCVVRMGDGSSFTRNGSGGAGFFPSFQLQLQFYTEDDRELSGDERLIRFENWADTMIEEMKLFAGMEGYLDVTSFTLSNLSFSDKKETHPFVVIQYEIQVH